MFSINKIESRELNKCTKILSCPSKNFVGYSKRVKVGLRMSFSENFTIPVQSHHLHGERN